MHRVLEAAAAHPAVREVGRQDEQRLEQGDQQHDDDHDRKRPPELAGRTGNEHHRQKGDHRGQDREGDRQRDVACALDCRLQARVAALPVLVDVLADHDGVVDDDAEHDEKREHRDHVDADADERQEQQTADEGNGHPDHDPEGEPQLEEHRQDQQHDAHRQATVVDQQHQAVAEVLGIVAVDAVADALGQGRVELRQHPQHRVLNVERRLAPDAVYLHLDRGLAIELGVKIPFLEAVLDAGDVAQGHAAAGRRGDDRDARELVGPLLALVHAQQNLPPTGLDRAGGQVPSALLDQPGDVAQGQTVAAQDVARHLDVGDVIGHVAEIDLGDLGFDQQAVAQVLGQLAQGPDVDVAVQADVHDLAKVVADAHFRVLGVLGKRTHPVDGLLDLLECLDAVATGHQFQGHAAATLVGRRGHFLDALEAAYGALDRLQDALLDLLRRRPRIGDVDLHDVHLEGRKHLLLHREGHVHAAGEQDNHQQIGGDGITRHPLDRAHARRAHGASAPASRRSSAPLRTRDRPVVTTRSPARRPLRT